MTVNWNSSLTWMAAWASSDEVVENGPAMFLPIRLWMIGAVVVGVLALAVVGLVVVVRRRRS